MGRHTRDIRRGVHAGVILTLAGPTPSVADWAFEDMLGVATSPVEASAGGRLGRGIGVHRIDHEVCIECSVLSRGAVLQQDAPCIVSSATRSN